jgi:hypothetical protein
MSVPGIHPTCGGEPPDPPDTKWRLRCDLAWGHVLAWFATGARGESPGYLWNARGRVLFERKLKAGVHLYFADCYLRLADLYVREGVLGRVGSLRAKAQWHIQAAGPLPEEPPPYAAVAMGIPGDPDYVDARGSAAPAVVTPFPRGLRPANAPAP